MKGKTSTWILLSAVFLVWGFAAWQLFTTFFGSEEEISVKHSGKYSMEENEEEVEYTLKANYRDPFLGGTVNLSSEKKTTSIRPVAVKKMAPVTPPPVVERVDISYISYLGTIKNKSANRMVSLINIHGKDYFMSEGDSAVNVKLLANLKDSVKIIYNQKQYFIKRK